MNTSVLVKQVCHCLTVSFTAKYSLQSYNTTLKFCVSGKLLLSSVAHLNIFFIKFLLQAVWLEDKLICFTLFNPK